MESSDRQPEIAGLNLVVLGSFNPAIFQPFWFAKTNLIRIEEAEAATLGLIHPQATAFATEWFSLQVTLDRFVLDTVDPTKYLPLRDLAEGTFRILEHTPLRAFGLNHQSHFRMMSEEEWHAFGNHLAPKDTWTSLLPNAGLLSMSILGKRDDSRARNARIKVEPSTQVHPGVFIDINQHYALNTDDERSPADNLAEFLSTLRSEWQDFIRYSESVSSHLLNAFSTPREE